VDFPFIIFNLVILLLLANLMVILLLNTVNSHFSQTFSHRQIYDEIDVLNYKLRINRESTVLFKIP